MDFFPPRILSAPMLSQPSVDGTQNGRN